MQTDRLPALISQAGTVDSSARSRTEPYCRTAGLLRGAGRHRRGAALVEVDRHGGQRHTEYHSDTATPHHPGLDGRRRSDVDQESEADETADEDEDQPHHRQNMRRVDRDVGRVALPPITIVTVIVPVREI